MMRNLLLTSAVVLGLLIVPASRATTGFTATTVSAMALETQTPDQPPPQPTQPAPQPAPQQPTQVTVDVHRDVHVWYANPVWMAIGGLTLLVIVAFVVMASRGGNGTTVVRG